MKERFILYRRRETYYCEDTVTRKQQSLRTKDEGVALSLLNAKNESYRQPILNLQIARTYLSASDADIGKRTWQAAMSEIILTKKGETHERYERAMQDEAFETIRNHPILETRPEHFLKVLRAGTVSTNIYLRRVHNFALDMNWLPWPVLNKKQWPAIAFGDTILAFYQRRSVVVSIPSIRLVSATVRGVKTGVILASRIELLIRKSLNGAWLNRNQ